MAQVPRKMAQVPRKMAQVPRKMAQKWGKMDQVLGKMDQVLGKMAQVRGRMAQNLRVKLPLIRNSANVTKTRKNQWCFDDLGRFWPSRWHHLAPKWHPKLLKHSLNTT